MDVTIMNDIAQLITTIGFPIVCVIFMWRKITDSDAKNHDLLTELTSTIRELTHYIKEHDSHGS